MSAFKFCQNFLEKALTNIHKKQKQSLITMVCSLLNQGTLSITGLGRSRPGGAKVKNKIRMSCRFLTSKKIYDLRKIFYAGATQWLLEGLNEFKIAVDWSGCCSDKYFLLRASLLYKGRSIPIYEEVHTAAEQEDDSVHKAFLDSLSSLIPKGKKVFIIFFLKNETISQSLRWHDKFSYLCELLLLIFCGKNGFCCSTFSNFYL